MIKIKDNMKINKQHFTYKSVRYTAWINTNLFSCMLDRRGHIMNCDNVTQSFLSMTEKYCAISALDNGIMLLFLKDLHVN